jgi:hypothetical protein
MPQSHFNKAEALALTDDFPAARAAAEKALAIFPDYAGALALLSWLMQMAREPAGDTARRALALDPRQYQASVVLAEIDYDLGLYAEVEARLRPVLAAGDVPPLIRARAQGFLADAVDRLGRPGEAFAAYTDGNEIVRRLHAPQFAAEGVPTVLDMAEWLDERFSQTDAALWAQPPQTPARDADEPARHVFLVGFPRSGTTLMENVLASHADVVDLDERDALIGAGRDLFVTDEGIDRLAVVDDAEIARRRADYFRRVREYLPDLAGKTLLDKHPLHTVRLPLIAKLFPDAKVLFARRDPRDVVLSCFRRRFRMNPAMYQLLTLEGAARYYDAVMRLTETYRAKLPVPMHLVRYESLVADFETEAAAICDFIGLEWSDSLLDFAEKAHGRDIRTPSAKQVRKGLYSEGMGQWRPYAAQLEPVMPLLKPWIDRFGYAQSQA